MFNYQKLLKLIFEFCNIIGDKRVNSFKFVISVTEVRKYLHNTNKEINIQQCCTRLVLL